MSPSVYETAQVLRFYPPAQGAAPALAWLVEQQAGDGGWGWPGNSLYRIVPTLAAILALRVHDPTIGATAAIEAGLAFLARNESATATAGTSAIPIAYELILPRLLADAAAVGLPVTMQPTAEVAALGRRRLARLATDPPPADTTPFVSWEAWGADTAQACLHPISGIGHSAAATAWWLQGGGDRIDLVARTQAARYLQRSMQAAGSGIAGVVAPFWPINRFEQLFMLHPLLLAGIMRLSSLQPVLRPLLEELWSALSPHGVGFSDYFTPDGDDTAAALGVLHTGGFPVSVDILSDFRHPTHFSAYPSELHTSLTVTARASHALAHMGYPTQNWQCAIVAAQQPDGWWYGDKWNISRFYSTCLALSALTGAEPTTTWRLARQALLQSQHPEGGWGEQWPTPVETSYALLALWMIHDARMLDAAGTQALAQGQRFLASVACTAHDNDPPMWIGKDLFRTPRIDRVFILSALLAPYGRRGVLRTQLRRRKLPQRTTRRRPV